MARADFGWPIGLGSTLRGRAPRFPSDGAALSLAWTDATLGTLETFIIDLGEITSEEALDAELSFLVYVDLGTIESEEDLDVALYIIRGLAPIAYAFSDTFRGGKQIAIGSLRTLEDTSLDTSFQFHTLPSGWSVADSDGSGLARPSLSGLLLSTGAADDSFVTLSQAVSYDSFDAKLTVELRNPSGLFDEYVTLCALSFLTATGSTEIRIVRDPRISSTLPVANGLVTTSVRTDEVGASLLNEASTHELEIVRHLNYLNLFVDGTLVFSTDTFVQDSGSFSIRTANEDASSLVSTRLKSLTMRSHALIAGRLLDDKIDFSAHKLVGNVPAATLQEVGVQPIIIFGPWGYLEASEGFEYTLPVGRSLARSRDSKTVTYDDSAVRDGDE